MNTNAVDIPFEPHPSTSAPAVTRDRFGRTRSEPRERDAKEGEILAKLWLGLFVTYTVAAVPLLTWAAASIL
jgi:hypothetical protein